MDNTFYAKKLRLLNEMATKLADLQRLTSLLSEHEEAAPAGDCSEFYNLGCALDEATSEVDLLAEAVEVLVKTPA
jgi:hypothetical protein